VGAPVALAMLFSPRPVAPRDSRPRIRVLLRAFPIRYARATFRASRLTVSALIAALAACGSACAQRPASGVVIVVHSDLGTALAQVAIELRIGGADGNPFHMAPYPVRPSPTDGADVVGTRAVTAPQPTTGQRLWVRVTARDPGQRDLVSQTALVTFVAEQVLRLDLFLLNRCRGVVCGSTETCGPGGACVSAERRELPEFVPDGGAVNALDAATDARLDVGTGDAARDIVGDRGEVAGGACVPGRAEFILTGIPQAVVVPAGCTRLTVRAWGGGGGAGGGGRSGGAGGGGGFVGSDISVVPGEAIIVAIGGGGSAGAAPNAGGAGQNGGGWGGWGEGDPVAGGGGGGGGGATQLVRGGTVIVSAAGGGGGGGATFAAGGVAGAGGGGGSGSGLGGAPGGWGTAGAPGRGGGGGGGGGGAAFLSSGTEHGSPGLGGTSTGNGGQSASGQTPGGVTDSEYRAPTALGGTATTAGVTAGSPGRIVVRW